MDIIEMYEEDHFLFDKLATQATTDCLSVCTQVAVDAVALRDVNFCGNLRVRETFRKCNKMSLVLQHADNVASLD
jgi:hypothetical protein